VGIFTLAIPKFTDYSKVWEALGAMTWVEYLTLLAATAFSVVSYWPQQTAAMPGLTISQAAVNSQSSTSIANSVPGGGLLSVGVSCAMYSSWGFSRGEIAISTGVTFIWNIFMKLGLPLIALALLAVTGKVSAAFLMGALIGLAALGGAITLFTLVLWKRALAERIGASLGRAASLLRRLVRRPPCEDWGKGAVRFRKQALSLVARRWISLSVSTVVSHLALYLVLLLALRHVGISEREVSWAQVLGVFAFGRLVTAFPLTPGGLGFVEISYIGGLVLAGQAHAGLSPVAFHAQVVAAVLVFRALTYGLQIPMGGLAYLVWQAKKSWRKAPLREPDLEPVLEPAMQPAMHPAMQPAMHPVLHPALRPAMQPVLR
jgi:uncharacterized membrane protein YbhN (UPF0104 family)